MSSPTGSDPNYPQGGAPQGQPGWSAPQNPTPGYNPAASYSGSPAGYGGAAAARPGMVTAAAIVGIVWGGLGILLELIALTVAFALFPLLGLIVLVALILSVALLVGGIFVLQGKSPKILLYTCYAAIVINIISLIISISQGGSAFSGVLGFIVPIVIIALLMQQQSKQYFAARGQSY